MRKNTLWNRKATSSDSMKGHTLIGKPKKVEQDEKQEQQQEYIQGHTKTVLNWEGDTQKERNNKQAHEDKQETTEPHKTKKQTNAQTCRKTSKTPSTQTKQTQSQAETEEFTKGTGQKSKKVYTNILREFVKTHDSLAHAGNYVSWIGLNLNTMYLLLFSILVIE